MLYWAVLVLLVDDHLGRRPPLLLPGLNEVEHRQSVAMKVAGVKEAVRSPAAWAWAHSRAVESDPSDTCYYFPVGVRRHQYLDGNDTHPTYLRKFQLIIHRLMYMPCPTVQYHMEMHACP